MDIQLNGSEIRLAERNDKATAVKILTKSFKYDPHIRWLLEKTSHRDKLEIIINYVVDETFGKGAIYLTNDNLGVALWHSAKKEKFTFEYIKRNLLFLFKLGISTVYRNLKSLKISHAHFPRKQGFCYLYLIGVLPEGQGKGLASKLMNPVLDHCRGNQIPVFLETANPKNVEIYQKKGFHLIDRFRTTSTLIHFMKLEMNNSYICPKNC
jgi:GNAT superfamily N-acetyltransferase